MVKIFAQNEQNIENITTEIKDMLKKVIKHTLKFEKWEKSVQISLTFTDDENIKEINSETRGIDKPTDVLSFPMLEYDENKQIIDQSFEMDGEYVVLGDIVISVETARRQAIEYGHSFEREMAFLTVHSMLHLLGYDHMAEDEEKEMFEKQEKILIKMGITR